MYAYIARQPIFNVNKQVKGYELLYRDGKSGNAANITDGDRATYLLLSDAVTLFGLPRLTNRHPAYINFTKNLLLNDFIYMMDPREIVVEIVEGVKISPEIIERLKVLKEKGYTLALDDYVGDPRFEEVLPYVDIIKVDFGLTDRLGQQSLANRFRKLPVTLLAEKVETAEDFDAALGMGYTLFQGYFFERPQMFNKRIPSLAASSFGRLLNELQKEAVDFDTCADIVRSDAAMTYNVLRNVSTLAYYRGNTIAAVKHGLVMMGVRECRRWAILTLARQNNVTSSDELVRKAYLRGLFIRKLMGHTQGAPNPENGFLLGMFSLLDKILGARIEDLLKDIDLDAQIKGTSDLINSTRKAQEMVK